jgi:class 3 adenylate cyclase/tetratricopeptide (TPR) repeat protein
VDLKPWLESLGLGEYASAFEAHHVDAALLPSLTAEDLRELGVTSVGHRRRLLAAIGRLQAAPPATEPAEEAAAPAVAPAAAREAPPVQRRQITVLFCDLVGSTALSVHVDPEDLRDLLTSYRAAMAKVVHEHNGWVAQFLGDGVLAYFGYPQAHEHDGENAVRAALAMVEAVRQLPPLGGHQAQVRIGIATGLTVIGRSLAGAEGSEDSADTSAVGEAPNLAARAQSLAEPNGIVIATSTRVLVADLFEFRDLGSLELKGFAAPVRLWEVLRESRVRSRYAALQTRRTRTSLVGREAETKRIASRLGAALAGDGQLLVITGEPGLGKSRLIEHLFELLGPAGEGAQRVILQCSPFNTASPLHPVRDFIERASGVSTADAAPVAMEKLSAMLAATGTVMPEDIASVAELLGIQQGPDSPLDGIGSHKLRERTMRTLSALLAVLAARSSVVVLEDMQWIDPSTSALLEGIVPELRRLPVLFVATVRSGPMPAWLGGAHVGLIQLDRLDAEQTGRVVEAMAAPRQLPAGVVETIVSRSDGVPLFAEELTRGYLEAEEGSEGDHAKIPATLSESLLARLDSVTHGRDIAPSASVLGREFPLAVLAGILPLDEAQFRRGIADLMEAGVFVAGRSRFGEAVAFRHQLVRDAAYQLLLRRDRIRLHGMVANILLTRFPSIAEAVPHIVAVNFSEAGDTVRAIEQWQRAGSEAERRSAYSEALVYFRRALALTRLLPEGRTRDEQEFHLVLNAIAPLIAIEGISSQQVEAEIDRAAALSQTLGTRASLIPALALKLTLLGAAGNLEASYALAWQISAAAEGGSEVDQLIAHRYLATIMIFRGQFKDAIAQARRFFEVYDAGRHAQHLVTIGPANHAVMLMVGMAECYTCLGEPAPALHWADKALAAARSDGRLHTLAQALAFAGCLLPALVDDAQRLERCSTELNALLEKQDLTLWKGHAELFCGIAQMLRGRIDAGLAQARRGVHLLVTGHAYSNAWYLAFARVCESVGALDDARHGLELAASHIEHGERWLHAEYLRVRARLRRSAGGDREAAIEDLQAALAVATHQEATLFIRRVQADLDALTASDSAHAG